MTEYIKNRAIELGFDACGIAKAVFLEEDAAFLTSWLGEGKQGEMSYLERNLEKRTDPGKIVEGCKSVIVMLTNFSPERKQPENAPQISKYAYSKIDYHFTIRERLRQLEADIIEQFGADCFNMKQQHSFVDSAPVLERRWAQRAGLGWIGKNKMLINPSLGSNCFISVLMINKELTYDTPMEDRCGTCTRCLVACPTGALQAGKGIDARKCISYQTIEKKGAVDEAIRSKLSGWGFGCDICNDVCPWNKTRSRPTTNPDFEPVEEIYSMDFEAWEQLGKPEFRRMFKNSAIIRAGYDKLKQNIQYLKINREQNQIGES